MKILGYTFHPFDEQDWETFAGADEGSLICYVDDDKTILIWSPEANVLSEMTTTYDDDDDYCFSQKDWTFTVVEPRWTIAN